VNILVTGGAGFIGSTIVDFYIKAGHRVSVVDDESTGCAEHVNKAARYHRVDIRDKSALSAIFRDNAFDVVNHHAAQIDVRLSVQDPVADAEINIKGFLNVLDISRKSKVRKFIFSSSGGTIYGECKKPAREGDPEVPLSPYGVAKLATEKYIQAYAALYGMKYTIFRYSNVYGPRQDPRGEAGVISIFTDRFLNDESAFIFGNGRQTRDFVYVGDVAQANVLALTKGRNEIFNIGTARETSVVKLFTEMAKITSLEKKAIFKPARLGELNRSVLNYSKAKNKLGWSPKMSLAHGLAETIRFFQ
jgi:UDP-glucose 4-epimerase